MKTFAFVVALTAFMGLNVCRAQESTPETKVEPTLRVVELKVLSAERYVANVRGEREDGTPYRAKNVLLSQANSKALLKLEQAVVHGPRIDTRTYSLDGQGYFTACGCHPLEWIDCELSGGHKIRIYLHHGVWSLPGESGFRLGLSKVESRSILDKLGWDKSEGPLKSRELNSFGKKDSPFGPILAQGRSSLKSPLIQREDEETQAVVSAECYVFKSPIDPSGRADQTTESRYLGQANQANLRHLGEVVLGRRCSTLRHMPNGRTLKVYPEDEAVGLIVCKMSGGQKVAIHIYSPETTWLVAGEDGFRLDISTETSNVILDPKGWSKEG